MGVRRFASASSLIGFIHLTSQVHAAGSVEIVLNVDYSMDLVKPVAVPRASNGQAGYFANYRVVGTSCSIR